MEREGVRRVSHIRAHLTEFEGTGEEKEGGSYQREELQQEVQKIVGWGKVQDSLNGVCPSSGGILGY